MIKLHVNNTFSLPISIIHFMMYRCSCQISIFFIRQDKINKIDVTLIIQNKRVDTN